MYAKKSFEFIDEFKFLGSAQAFEETFYKHVTKGEVGYNHKGYADLKSGQKLFIGTKTLDNQGNYRVRLNQKTSPMFGTHIETYLEIIPGQDYLKIRAITRPNEGNIFFIKFSLWLCLLIFILVWIFLTIQGYWYAIVGLIPLIFVYYGNQFFLKDALLQLRTRFIQYFLTWEHVQAI